MKSQKRIYSSRILKAGALLDETKTLLSVWDEFASIVDNIARFQLENILGKASRSKANDILMAFRQRYLVDERVMRSLIRLTKGRCPVESINKILGSSLLHVGRLNWSFPSLRYIISMKFLVVLKPLAQLFAD